MKAAFFAEFSAVKKTIIQSFAVYFFVSFFVGIGTQSAITIGACISAMTPMLLAFSFAGYDHMNGWERFRATLPVSRDALVVGRYLNVLASSAATMAVGILSALLVAWIAPSLPIDATIAGAFAEEAARPFGVVAGCLASGCFMLVFVALFQPFILRYGLTKALRWLPAGILIVIFLIVMVAPQLIDVPAFLIEAMAILDDPANQPAILAGIIAATLAVYVASCAAAMALYQRKEL